VLRAGLVALFVVSIVVCAWTALWAGAWVAALVTVIGFFLLMAELQQHRARHAQLFDEQHPESAPQPHRASNASVDFQKLWSGQRSAAPARAEVVCFQLAHKLTGRLIHTYAREGAALAFVRDIVRLRSRQDAAQFRLRVVPRDAPPATVAEGDQLVQMALEDRVL